MAISASWAVQEAIHARLVADATLIGLLGGPHVYDHVPRAKPYPYVTFGQTIARDWSTGSEDGEEHLVSLNVWTDGGGRKAVQAIVAALRAALHDEVFVLSDHRLVSLRQELADVARQADGDTFRAIVRFRAVTEPI